MAGERIWFNVHAFVCFPIYGLAGGDYCVMQQTEQTQPDECIGNGYVYESSSYEGGYRKHTNTSI